MTADLGWWKGKDVFLTGVTGFKGAWLCVLLDRLGARVHGYGLAPQGERSMFVTCNIAELCKTMVIGDIRDVRQLESAIDKSNAAVCLHLAAQALVLESIENPTETFSTNVVGTSQVLEVLRDIRDKIESVLVVTSDKCYHNEEWIWGYRESDRLGGKDPYSASKGCAELVVDAFRRTYFDGQKVASARAGNVIGGGDWSANRIIPDCVRAFERAEKVIVRSPDSVRPWQHVLEPLVGYLMLAQKVAEDPNSYPRSLNFGPNRASHQSVSSLVTHLGEHWGKSDPMKVERHEQAKVEAKVLCLDSTKAKESLGWQPRLRFTETIAMVAEWYKTPEAKQVQVTRDQIERYLQLLE